MLKRYLIPILIIIGLTVFIWHKLLFQVPLGEGYYYFDFKQRTFDFWEYDNFAKVILTILIPLFKGNLTLYMGFELLSMILLHLSFFAFIYYVTKNRMLSIITTILFLSNFTGNFEMLGTANYHRLIQRVTNIIPLFISFIFFVKFITSKNKKDYILSLALFCLSLWMAHFSTFLTPFFIIYPLVFGVTKKVKISEIIKLISLSIPFLILNKILISKDHLAPHTNLISFIQDTGLFSLSREIALQLANMLLPIPLIQKIISISTPFTDTIIMTSIPIIVIFILGTLFVQKKKPEYSALYLSSLIMVPILLFLSIYLGKINVEYNIGGHMDYFVPENYDHKQDFNFLRGDRYYYVPTFFISIMLAILFTSILTKRSRFILIPIILLYITYNTNQIWIAFEVFQPICDSTKNYLNFIKTKKLDNETTIVSLQDILWPAPYIRTVYNLPDLKFVLKKGDWQNEIKDRNKTYVFEYDYKNNKVIDLSQKQGE